MERLKQCISQSQGWWSEVKEKERGPEGEEMTLGLYECLRAVGLQRHYARFTSMGVSRAAQLSALTMEDYPILGVCTMEDRTRLFHLVQMVKTDLESLVYEDDYNDEGYAVVDSSFTRDSHRGTGEDVYDDEDDNDAALNKQNASPFARSSRVRRQLDFSVDTTDHHQRLLSHSKGTVHLCASHNRNDGPVQGQKSAIPVQFGLNNGSVVVCGSKGNSSHRIDAHSHPSDDHTGRNTKTDIIGGISMYNCHTRLSPKCVSFHKPKPRLATVTSKRINNKLTGRKDRKGISRKEKLCTEKGSNGASEHMAKPMPVYESKRTAGYNYGLPRSSPSTLNKRRAGNQQITVCVRKRPLTHAESRRGEADVVTTPGGECVIVHESKEAVDLTQYILQHRFYFDQVFGEESSNEEVYRRTAYPLVQHMINGGKATCFAYGQTGAGKTHTMLGSSPGKPGLYALAVRDIFAHLSTTHTHSPLLVYVSFFEIYCGQLYDLLDHRKRLFAREDGRKVVHIAGLHDVRVDSVNSLLEVISQGTEERTQGMSGVNPLSSRSHALLQIQLRDPNQQIAGRMWFVDLAGSERASDSKEPDKQSRIEGAEINQSLLALKECIRSLDQEQLHTPFRQSKLTLVLKDSFVGDSMTCMIANISPGHLATEHTLNTLRYADRVKELRGQGGLRGGRRGSNSSSSGSVGTRGKSPPKKAKLVRQRKAVGPITPTTRLPMGGAILCSTPKNSRWGEEASARGRKTVGLEHITPIRGWLGTGDKREKWERADERESRGRENERYAESQSVSNQNAKAVLVVEQSPDEQLHSREEQKEEVAHEANLFFSPRESVSYHREKEIEQSNMKGGKEEEIRWIEQRRQVETSRNTYSKVERQNKRDLQKADERNKEKERHLRWYHQQLQQFMPSTSSSSADVFSPFQCPSFSSSNQASPSSSVSASSCSSPQHSSHLSVSELMYHGLEEVLDVYRARAQVRAEDNRGQLPFPSGEIFLQPETSSSYNNNNDDNAHGDSGGVDEDWRLSWEGTDARFRQDRGRSEKKRSVKATCKARVRKEDNRPAGIEGGERRWAWVTATEAEHTDSMTGAIPNNIETQVSYNCDSEDRTKVDEEGLDASDVPADGLWSTEEGGEADSCVLVSVHSNNDSNSLFSHPPFESSHQRAPAERPFSPACEHTNTLLTPNKLDVLFVSKLTRCTSNILPLPFQNTPQDVASSSHRKKKQWLATNASRRQLLNVQSTPQPLTTSITQTGCKIPGEPLNKLPENPSYTQLNNPPEDKDKMSVLPQDETYADSLSYIMDPLSISLLQIDQQVATDSFLQGEQNNTSVCPLGNEMGKDNRRKVEEDNLTCAEMVGNVVEDEDIEFRLSLLELPEAKTHHPATSDSVTAINHNEQRKDMCCATYEHCGIGRKKHPIAEVSLQDQKNTQKPQTMPVIEVLGNKAPASPLNLSTYASMQTSVTQTITPSVQHSGNISSPSSYNLIPNGTTQMLQQYPHNMHSKPAMSTRRSESVLGHLNTLPSQYHTVHSNHFRNSNNSFQSNSHTESNDQESTSNQQIRPIIHLPTLEDLDPTQWCVVRAHWEQLEEMEALCHKEGVLLCQQPDMAFGEYIHKLEKIMERKAQCVHSMRAQLQPYLKPSHSNQTHNQGGDNNN